MVLRRNQLPSNYAQIAQNFLYEIKKMEAEVHAYLQRCPVPTNPVVKIPVARVDRRNLTTSPPQIRT